MKIKKYIFCWLIFCSFCFGLFNQNALSQTILPKSARTLQMEALAFFQPSLFTESNKYIWGMGLVEVNSKTGEIWAMSLFGTPYYSATGVMGGFFSGSLKNTGTTPWTGVTVSANFEIITLTGCAILKVDRAEKTGSGYLEDNIGYMTVCGPGTYTVSSTPFTMKANTEYKGHAWIYYTSPEKNKAGSVYGKITSIKFNFP